MKYLKSCTATSTSPNTVNITTTITNNHSINVKKPELLPPRFVLRSQTLKRWSRAFCRSCAAVLASCLRLCLRALVSCICASLASSCFRRHSFEHLHRRCIVSGKEGNNHDNMVFTKILLQTEINNTNGADLRGGPAFASFAYRKAVCRR